jgi:hypothetical protein
MERRKSLRVEQKRSAELDEEENDEKSHRDAIGQFISKIMSSIPQNIDEFDPELENYHSQEPLKASEHPYFRLLKQNIYKHPLRRENCEHEDVPQCCCKPQTGCDLNCQNRLLFM